MANLFEVNVDPDFNPDTEETTETTSGVLHSEGDSDNDAEELHEVETTSNSKKRGNCRNYDLMAEFENYREAKEYMSKLDNFKWKRGKTNKSYEGDKQTYSCNETIDCSVLAYILVHNTSDKCSVFKSDEAHHHTYVTLTGIDNRVKKRIADLYTNGIKRPNLIIRALNNQPDFHTLPTFTKKQLSNFLTQLRTKLFGSFTISLTEIAEFVTKSMEIHIKELCVGFICSAMQKNI